MQLRKQKFADSDKLQPNNVAWYQLKANAGRADYCAVALGNLFAMWLDAIASGDMTHITIGQPRKKGAYLVTENWADDTATRAGGTDMVSLVEQMVAEFTVTDAGGGEGK